MEIRIVAQKRVSDYHAEIAEARLDVVELGREKRTDLRVLSDLLAIMRRFRPDVVVCENFNATFWGRLAGLVAGIPVVTAEHSTDRAIRQEVVISNRALGPFTRAVVACAEAQITSLEAEGNPSSRIRVIRNGVDTCRFAPDAAAGARFRGELGIPADAFVVGMAAAHRPEKRHDRFIWLLEQLLDTGRDAWGLAVGGGSLLENTMQAASRSRARERIILAGARADMVAAYSAMSLLVLLSDSTETFPLVSLEAQACATPVLAVDVGGVRETMDADRSGFIVPQDDLQSLVNLIVSLMIDPGKLDRAGVAARGFVTANLSESAMIGSWESLLNEVVAP